MMSNMAPGNDWLEDGSFEEALAHFDAQDTEETVGPLLPAGATLVSAVSSYGGTVVPMSSHRPVGVLIGATLTHATA